MAPLGQRSDQVGFRPCRPEIECAFPTPPRGNRRVPHGTQSLTMSASIRGGIVALTRVGMALAFLAGAGTPAALAQSAFWNTAVTAGGGWGIPSNWQGGAVPSGPG